eukprot:404918_1
MYTNSNVIVEWLTPRIVKLVLDNTSVHQLTLGLVNDLIKTLSDLEQNPKCLAYILTSNISQRLKANKRPIFCAGLDLKLLSKNNASLSIEYFKALTLLWETFNTLSKPIIGAINGDAMAGGAMVASLCDYRILVNDHFIQFKETRLGLDIDEITYGIALRCAGSHDKAAYITQTGKPFAGNNAIKYGLASDVVYTNNKNEVDGLLITECLKVLNNDYLRADIGAASTARQRGRQFLVKQKIITRQAKNLSTLSSLKNKVLTKSKL